MRSAFLRSASLDAVLSRVTFVFLAASLLALPGCSTSTPGPSSFSPSSFVATAEPTGGFEGAAVRPVRGGDVGGALASMPEPGGSPINVREKFFSNGVKQDIILAGDRSPFGENTLSVAIQSAPAAAGTRGVPVSLPSEAGIKNEIVARYPQVSMQILTQPRRNALGTFGLAIGRHASGVRCVYAWQYVEDVRNPGSSTTALGRLGTFGSTAQPASIRINMCRKDATVDDLAMAVEGLTLAAPSTIDRALDGSRASTSVATRPAGGGGIAVAATEGSLEGALTTAVRPERVASGGGERRRVARRERKREPAAEESVQPQAVAVAPPAYSTGPRYLAPVAGAPAGSVYGAAPMAATPTYTTSAYAGAPAYGGSMPAAGKTLDPSLPAAAYRGPSGRSQ